jgi:threonine dehydrogenase-like Zn-dependent dehydrogenase
MITVQAQKHRLEMAKAFAVEAVIDGAREDVLAPVLQETGPRELR